MKVRSTRYLVVKGRRKKGPRGSHRPAWYTSEDLAARLLGAVSALVWPGILTRPVAQQLSAVLSILFLGPRPGHGRSTVWQQYPPVKPTGGVSISAESAPRLQVARWMCGAATVQWLQRTCLGWTNRPWLPVLAWCSTCKPAR